MLEETAVGVSKGDGADVAEHSAPTWTNRHIGVGKPAELDTQQIPSTDGAPGPMTPLNSDVAAPLIDSRSSSLRGCQTGASLSNGALLPPGSEPELQDAIRDSPFLDLSSPMTPYEWLKIPIMVQTQCLRTFPLIMGSSLSESIVLRHMYHCVLHAVEHATAMYLYLHALQPQC